MQKIMTCPTCSSRNVLPIINNKKATTIKDACLCSIVKFAITNYGTKAVLILGKMIGSKAPVVGSFVRLSCGTI